MAKHVAMIGLSAEEVKWLKLLVQALRHKDPVVVELSKQAIAYLQIVADRPEASHLDTNQVSLAMS